ncbi:MAG TPA: L-threonylcarbamoyladenylate synthase [Dermatophilaceae bacterium]|jgi:tRNA threonylcarbamoyl adenosine modification protein (Sua5/YciO/YrdC/YwlC family)|nr:L-threonylcarbamoyladenylate synthase [Dermatophilaceae bacterium]
MSPVYDCTTEEGRAEGIAKAAEAARAGEVVVLPTDTVYGVGTDAFSTEGVRSILAAKGRGREMPPPVLVPNVRAVDGLASDVPPYARDLIREFWPGALTLVLEAQPSLAWDLGDTNGTVALRMPDDELALEVLEAVGPMAVTSANRTGEPAATTMVEAATQLGAAVKVYLDDGPRSSSQASTILDCTGEVPVVLRAGAISQEQLDRVLAEAAETASATEATEAAEPVDAAETAQIAEPAEAAQIAEPAEAADSAQAAETPETDLADPPGRVPALEPGPETDLVTHRLETGGPEAVPEMAPEPTGEVVAPGTSEPAVPPAPEPAVGDQTDPIELPAQQTQTAGEHSA